METTAVTFKARTWEMAANVYFPNDFDSAQSYPAVIIVHPVGSCKEQSPAIYASHLAKAGF